jgi:hypothetical protein
MDMDFVTPVDACPAYKVLRKTIRPKEGEVNRLRQNIMPLRTIYS